VIARHELEIIDQKDDSPPIALKMAGVVTDPAIADLLLCRQLSTPCAMRSDSVGTAGRLAPG
jgi:hypothetical protein